MNRILLPNYFKRIGLIFFLIGFLPSFARGFIDGFTGQYNPDDVLPYGIDVILKSISYIGITFYFLAKEKVFDELFQQLRSDAIHTTFVISAMVMTIVSIGQIKVKWSVDWVIMLQMATFLIIFYFKKKSVLPTED
ncbi:MAG: hypothetical protein AAFQ94_28410 [Bacteroidota bacterium]